jgi:N-acetylmuramoyl-L-alanine amidase
MARVVIDPGHGGSDPGAISVGGRCRESDNVLAIARGIHGKEPNLPGVQFAYTRLEDKDLGPSVLADLAARVKFAEDAKADLFVSIHQNADGAREGKGVEVHYYLGSVEGERLANAILKAIVDTTGLINRGAKPGRLYVVKNTTMPAVLVECGFVGGDPKEAALVSSKETIDKFAVSIMRGIADYLDIEYGQKSAERHWAQLDLDWLLNEGIITTPRLPEQPVLWGEFAAVMRRVLKRINF